MRYQVQLKQKKSNQEAENCYMNASKSLLLFLDKRIKEDSIGGIKIGFEGGKPSSIAKSTNPDKDVPEITSCFDLEDVVRKACSVRFYGTLFFVYRAGKITHFHINQTWQGRLLDDLLSRESEAGGKTRLVMMKS